MTLHNLIADHRQLYAADRHISRLATTTPPPLKDPETGLYSSDPGHLGMTLTGRFARLLGHPDGFGTSFPWTKALWALRVECRRKHPYHRGADVPYWRGSLCHQAVTLVIIGTPKGDGPASLQEAQQILRYDHLEPVLRDAFAFIEQSIDDQRARAERRAKEDAGIFGVGNAPLPVVEHHAPSAEHVLECPNPECRRKRAA
jgi:hypothetical protein